MINRLSAEDTQSNNPQQDSIKTKTYTLETITVIGQVPAETIGSLSIKNLDTSAQANPVNIRDALLGEAGISVTTGTKDESNLRIRGFRKNESKVLIDGRPLNSGYFGSFDLQNLPLSDIKAVHILKGPASSIYGNNTMGGVINLITRKPSADKWAKLALQTKRNNTNHIELSTSHSFTDWDYWLYTARDNTDGFVLSKDFNPTLNENGAVRNHLQKTQYNLQARSSFNLSELHTLGITAGYTYINHKKIPPSIYGIDDEFRTYKNWYRYQSTLMNELILTENKSISSMLWLDGGADTYQTFRDISYQQMMMNSTLRYGTVGFAPRFDLEIGSSNKLTTGLRSELIYSTRKDNGSYLTWTAHNLANINIFGHFEHLLSQSLTLAAGSGLSAYWNDSRDELKTFIEPTAGAYYTHTDGSNLSVSAGLNSAYPTMRQLFSSDNGNPHLKPQYALKYELAYDKPLRFNNVLVTFGTVIFHNSIADLIEEKDGIYTNLHWAKTYGFETDLTIKPINFWEINGDFTLLKALKNNNYRLIENPVHKAKLSTTLQLPNRLSFSVSSEYCDYRISQDNGGDYHILPSYWVHNVFIKKQIKNAKLKLGLENFTDTYFEEEYGFPSAGINFNLGMEIEI